MNGCFVTTWNFSACFFFSSHGCGQDESPFTMAVPIRRGHVTKPSKNSFESDTNLKTASKGCNTTQTADAKKATGHTRNNKMMIQSIEKQGLPMINDSARTDFFQLLYARRMTKENKCSFYAAREREKGMNGNGSK
jgi:hypothetical protein